MEVRTKKSCGYAVADHQMGLPHFRNSHPDLDLDLLGFTSENKQLFCLPTDPNPDPAESCVRFKSIFEVRNCISQLFFSPNLLVSQLIMLIIIRASPMKLKHKDTVFYPLNAEYN